MIPVQKRALRLEMLGTDFAAAERHGAQLREIRARQRHPGALALLDCWLSLTYCLLQIAFSHPFR